MDFAERPSSSHSHVKPQCADAAELRGEPSRVAFDGAARFERKAVSCLRFDQCLCSFLANNLPKSSFRACNLQCTFFYLCYVDLMVFNLHIQMICRTLWTRCVAAFLVIVRARQYFRCRERLRLCLATRMARSSRLRG